MRFLGLQKVSKQLAVLAFLQLLTPQNTNGWNLKISENDGFQAIWWFHFFLLCSPLPGEMIQFDL